MYPEEKISGGRVLNSFSHNNLGDPHAQYNSHNTYDTKNNTGNYSRWVCIFRGNFQANPGAFTSKEAEYNRLLWDATIYSMEDDNIQNVNDLSFYVVVKPSGVLYLDLASRNRIGSDTKAFKLYYKKIQSSPMMFGICIYAELSKYKEKIKIKQNIYDVAKNYSVPYHLKASRKGTNMYQKLEDCYKDLSSEELVTKEDLDTLMEGWKVKNTFSPYRNFTADFTGSLWGLSTKYSHYKEMTIYRDRIKISITVTCNNKNLTTDSLLFKLPDYVVEQIIFAENTVNFTVPCSHKKAGFPREFMFCRLELYKDGTITVCGLPKLDESSSNDIYIDLDIKTNMSYVELDEAFSEIPVITSFTSDKESPQTVGTNITLVASAKGNGELQYKFLLRDELGEWTLLRDFDVSNTFVWNSNVSPGPKTLYVDVKDSQDNVVRKSKLFEIESPINAPIITSFEADKASPQIKGTKITLTVAATGEGDLQYKFMVKDSTTSKYATIRDYNTDNTCTWTASSSGTKILYVYVKDALDNESSENIEYTITGPTTYGLTTDKVSPQVEGTEIKLIATVSNGTGTYQYKFLVKDVTTDSWTVIKDFSTDNTAIWTAELGTKSLYVDIKDTTNDATVRKSIENYVITASS